MRRDELLAAAVRVFARKGYHTCRVSDIADAYAVCWGTLDEVLTGSVLGRLPGEPGDVDVAEATVTAMRRALAPG